MSIKNIPSIVRTLGVKANPPCVSTPGKFNSCESSDGTPLRVGISGEVPPPDNCCDQLQNLSFGVFNDCSERVGTNPFTFQSPPTLDCNFDISFTFLPYFEDRTLLLELFVDGNPIIFTPGNPQTISLSPGSTIYAQATTGLLYIPNLIDITAYNETCDIYYGNIGSLNLWRSMECTIFPLWDIPMSLSDNGTTLFSSTYQYTGGANPIYLEIYVTPIVFNLSAEIYAWVGPDPNPTNNPYYPLVNGGVVGMFPALVPLNPGDYFTLYHDAGDGKCSIYQLEIFNRCSPELCEQYFLLEEFIVNRANCGA